MILMNWMIVNNVDLGQVLTTLLNISPTTNRFAAQPVKAAEEASSISEFDSHRRHSFKQINRSRAVFI